MKNLGWLGALLLFPSACELDECEDDGTPGMKMLGGRGGVGLPGSSEAGGVVDEAVGGEEEEGVCWVGGGTPGGKAGLLPPLPACSPCPARLPELTDRLFWST